jgi:hypothetical protein
VRIQRVVLEHHRDVALHRRQAVDQLRTDANLAGGDLLEPGDHPQGGGLAATGRTNQHQEFVIADLEVEVLHRVKTVVVFLVQRADRNTRHSQPFTDPVSPAT